MSRKDVFRFFAHDKRMRATLVKHDGNLNPQDVTCCKCGRVLRSNHVASIVQWGFVEDLHWDVYNCFLCGVNTAHEYVVTLTEKQMIERFPKTEER